MQGVQNLKKQVLESIIEGYLQRKNPQNLFYLKRDLSSSTILAKYINSNIEEGLQIQQMQLNQQLYGKNYKQKSKNYLFKALLQVFQAQKFSLISLLFAVMIVLQFSIGALWDDSESILSASSVLIIMILWKILQFLYSWRSAYLRYKSNHRKQRNKYQVIRKGETVQINEEQIRVGDILLIDFNQTIPASGILLSDLQIVFDQKIFNLNIQKKRNIQGCLKYIEHKSQLALKIENENGQLPSPFIIRGSRMLNGSLFKMMVLTVEQEPIIQKYSIIKKQDHFSDLQSQIHNISKKIKKVVNFCLVIIIIFHAFLLIFKANVLKSTTNLYIIKNIIQSLQALLAIIYLVDGDILLNLLKTQYFHFANMIGKGEINKFLLVQQIFIRQQNICKYDEIIPKKIILLDLNQPIQIQLLSAMNPKINYNFFYQILAGVGLSTTLSFKIANKHHKNVIVHLNSSQQKVFSSFYANSQTIQVNNQNQDNDSVGQMLKKHQITSSQNKNQNSVKLKNSNQKKIMDISLNIEYSQNKLPVKGIKTEQVIGLEDYLSKQCKFSTKQILQNLNKLAKNSTRTYYYQKYTLLRLSKIQYIWSNQKFTLAKLEDKQKILIGINRLQRQGLIPFLIGIDEGAFHNQYMTYLFGVIGVQIQYQQNIRKTFQSLSKIGIKSTIILFKQQIQHQENFQFEQYYHDFIKRGWISQKQSFCNIEKIKKNGGKKLCKICFKDDDCECTEKNHQLINIQGFIHSIEQVKCIYNVKQEDISYLQQGYQQMNIKTLNIIDQKIQTEKVLNKIILGYDLISSIQSIIVFWILSVVLVFFYYFPFNYLTIGSLFPYQHLYFILLYLTILNSNHYFKKDSSLSFQQRRINGSRNNKNLFGMAIKCQIAIFTILTIIMTTLILYFTDTFIENKGLKDYIYKNECARMKSFYHNSYLKTYKCKIQNKDVIIYSKLSSYIFSFIVILLGLRSFTSKKKIFKIKNVLFHFIVIVIILIIIQESPQALRCNFSGLSIVQLFYLIAMSLLIIFISRLVRYAVSCSYDNQNYHFQFNILMRNNKINKYYPMLKQYNDGKTLQFKYQNLDSQDQQ